MSRAWMWIMSKILIDAFYLNKGKPVEGKLIFDGGLFISDEILHIAKQEDIGTLLFLSQRYNGDSKESYK